MKYTNFKTLSVMLAAAALLALSGCGSTGESSDTGFGDTTPIVTPPIEGNIPPVANAGVDQIVAYGQDVTLEGNASSDPDGTIVLYEWTDSSDAIIGTQANTVVSGLAEGIHTFKLTVTDNDGAIDTDTVSVEVDVQICLDQADNGYGTIDLNGRTWLDRNLGATAVANVTMNNPESYGNLYQWGRGADGHEDRTSANTAGGTGHATTILPDTGEAWDGLFINEGDNGTNFDWTKSNVDPDGLERAGLWGAPSSESNLNQVCPCGYIVASVTEFTDLNTTDVAALKLPLSGYRGTDGIVYDDDGYYWTRDAGTTGSAPSIHFDGSSAVLEEWDRMEGESIRCIKPQ